MAGPAGLPSAVMLYTYGRQLLGHMLIVVWCGVHPILLLLHSLSRLLQPLATSSRASSFSTTASWYSSLVDFL